LGVLFVWKVKFYFLPPWTIYPLAYLVFCVVSAVLLAIALLRDGSSR
jgi:hypothetical protein